MDNFLGNKYKQVSSENLNEYYKKIGFNCMLIRKLLSKSSPTICLTQKNGIYKIHTASKFVTIGFDFRLGEERVETLPNGRKRVVIFTQQGNVLQQYLKYGDHETFTTYTFTENELYVEIKIEDIVSTRTCRLVEQRRSCFC